ncbi:MAG TPA: hypothetical protein PLA94_16950 [Myxococcota bacterium]|nr:hypothetical protein [Myxococcota bacterium]
MNDLTRYQPQFVAQKALFSFFGSSFRILGRDGSLQFFVKQKAFKIKEEITIFADEGQTQPMLRIRARSALDFSATYDVVDAASGERIGACRREGLKSILRDSWLILGDGDATIAKLQEDSGAMALLRRFFPIIPQTFHVSVDGQDVGYIKQRFTFFRLTYDVDFSRSPLDPRLGVAITVLLLAIEGRQKGG